MNLEGAMAKRIAALEAGGIAEQLGLREGDVLFSINGEAVLDTSIIRR